MRAKVLVLSLAAAMVIGGTASAAELRIGYVNAVKVIEEAPQGQEALKKLEAEFGPRDKKIVEMQNRIKALEQEMEKNELVMKDTERRAREHEIATLKRDLRRATQEFREDYNLRRNEELATLQKIVHRAIVEFAKQENYDLIVHEGVIHAGPKVDITDRILKKLGKK